MSKIGKRVNKKEFRKVVETLKQQEEDFMKALAEHNSQKEIETIKHAAVKSECGKVVTGKSHADCFHKGILDLQLEMSQREEDQGFVTSTGRYVSREEAQKIAIAAGQVAPTLGNLYSEELWGARSLKKYQYDSENGYCERKPT